MIQYPRVAGQWKRCDEMYDSTRNNLPKFIVQQQRLHTLRQKTVARLFVYYTSGFYYLPHRISFFASSTKIKTNQKYFFLLSWSPIINVVPTFQNFCRIFNRLCRLCTQCTYNLQSDSMHATYQNTVLMKME